MTRPTFTCSPLALGLIWMVLGLAWCIGILGRGYWTPDEPREADIAWRMSYQTGKAVPLLAGEAFCEKPPLTYWIAGAAMAALGPDARAARLPNLLYALVTALAVGSLGRRSAGPLAGLAAAAAISTFLLSYQVAIWLATDAPLLCTVAVALLGLHIGFYAKDGGARLRGYSCMHAALALGFLAKSAAAWMVPVLCFMTLVIWERRWRELRRWELYLGLGLQAAIILPWIGAVYAGPEGTAHLKVFFWNNLVGRFTAIDAPGELQYAAAHRNSPGKYLLELPAYLWPWTLLAMAAAGHAWRERRAPEEQRRPLRFAFATFVPTVVVLSLAATARNIYLAPALPGVALLIGVWARDLAVAHGPWDRRALRGTSLLLLLGVLVFAAALAAVAADAWQTMNARGVFVAVSGVGLAAAAGCAIAAWRSAGRGRMLPALLALLLAYGALLAGPASQLYRRVDAWQDLAAIGRAIRSDASDRPLILFAPDETTRAFIDLYTRPAVITIPGPVTAASTGELQARLTLGPRSVVVTQLPGRSAGAVLQRWKEGWGPRPPSGVPQPDPDEIPGWARESGLRIAHRYALPNGRRYALLDGGSAAASR